MGFPKGQGGKKRTFAARNAALLKQRGFSDADFTATYNYAKRPVAPPTERAYNATGQYFREFLKDKYGWPEDRITIYTSHKAPPIEPDILKNFLFYWASKGEGVIDKGNLITKDTLVRRWKNFTGWISRETGKEVSKEVMNDVNGYIETELLLRVPLKAVHREKHNTTELDYDVLMTQIWSLDAFVNTHGRQIIQMPLIVHMLFFFGIQRVGAFLSTSDYSELALQYKDLEVTVHHKMNEPMLFVKYKSDHMKGRKGTDEWHKTVQHEQRQFKDCSVLLILALAFADNAFQDVQSPEELLAIRPHSNTPRLVPFKPEKSNQYVLRSRFDNSVSDNLFRRHYKEMVLRAGYVPDHMQLYNIRRGITNRVKDHISSSRLQQVMGHRSGAELVKFYQTRTIDIDFQGIVLRGEQDSNIDYGAFLRSQRGARPPTELPSSMMEEIEASLAGVPHGSNAYYSTKRSLTKTAWSDFLKAWHQRDNPNQTRCPSSLIPDSCELVGDLLLQETRARILLDRYCPEHPRIAEALSVESFDIRSEKGLEVLQFLIRLAGREQVPQTFWYPSCFPIRTFGEGGQDEYACPICSQDLTKMSSASIRPVHIHRCQRKKFIKRAGQAPQHCYRCNLWFSEKDEWREHCRRHYIDLDMFCGLWKESKIIVVAGRCPFCLSDQFAGDDWDERIVEFCEAKQFIAHIGKHLELLGSDILSSCPHPLCDKGELFRRPALVEHFSDVHGIKWDYIKRHRKDLLDTTEDDDEPASQVAKQLGFEGLKDICKPLNHADEMQGASEAQHSPTDYSSLSVAMPLIFPHTFKRARYE